MNKQKTCGECWWLENGANDSEEGGCPLQFARNSLVPLIREDGKACEDFEPKGASDE